MHMNCFRVLKGNIILVLLSDITMLVLLAVGLLESSNSSRSSQHITQLYELNIVSVAKKTPNNLHII